MDICQPTGWIYHPMGRDASLAMDICWWTRGPQDIPSDGPRRFPGHGYMQADRLDIPSDGPRRFPGHGYMPADWLDIPSDGPRRFPGHRYMSGLPALWGV